MCLRTIWNIRIVLNVIIKNVIKTATIGIKYHSLVIQNLTTFATRHRIQKARMSRNTRGTVTIALYRKWRVRASRRSTDTAVKTASVAPIVIQPDTDWSIFKKQNAVKLSLSSAILNATNSGWQIKPTIASEAARQPKRTNDGKWRSWVFLIVNKTRKFPKHVAIENKQLRIHITIFVMKMSCFLSKLMNASSKKKHALSVSFMAKDVALSKKLDDGGDSCRFYSKPLTFLIRFWLTKLPFPLTMLCI